MNQLMGASLHPKTSQLPDDLTGRRETATQQSCSRPAVGAPTLVSPAPGATDKKDLTNYFLKKDLTDESLIPLFSAANTYRLIQLLKQLQHPLWDQVGLRQHCSARL